ncbi:MAG: archaellin/type IV pilin N-terminal domain-containing protein [Candidatus Bathyarchaeia archaeon]
MGKQFSKRGVSVIIASLLLIAIAVAAAVLLYVFSIGLMGSLGSSGGQQTKDQVIMEAYDWTTAGTLTLNLKNVGSSTVNLATGTPGADYFVNGVAIATVAISGCATPSAVAPGSTTCVAKLTLPTFTPALTSGAAYSVKVVLPDGGVFSYTAINGQAS